MEERLSNRQDQILGAVVETFIDTAEPVGSRHLARKLTLGLSSATLRSALAELAEQGLLDQPHTSAGRRPTDRGYRYYLDHLMETGRVRAEERRHLHTELADPAADELTSRLHVTCRALSDLARQVGLVVAPRFSSRVFRHIDFTLLEPARVMVVLVTETGAVFHRKVDAPEIDRQSELDRMAIYLDQLLQGLPLREVRARLRAELETERAAYDRLIRHALDLGARALGPDGGHPEAEVFHGDPVTVLDHPEFRDPERMRTLSDTLEKKSLLLTLLDRAAETQGVQVTVGAENGAEALKDCAMVVTSYGNGDRVFGSLGVIGPTRMPYRRVVGLVAYTARLLGDTLAHT